MKICHFTSLHNRYDTRVFVKQCCSLAKSGHQVTMIVADGEGNETKDGVQFIDVGDRGKRRKRLVNMNPKIINKALEIDADIYFYHDPELSFYVLRLVRAGKKVIYDAHEDSPRQYVSNARKKGLMTNLISKTLEYVENRAARKIYAVMTATEGIKERYDQLHNNVSVIKNFPIISELENDVQWESKKNQVCYIGGLRNTRGIKEIASASKNIDLPLILAGPWQPSEYEHEIMNNYSNVEYVGYLGREEISNLLAESKVGLLTLYKTPNHMHALPVKLYEYMAAGVPVISTDIPLWKSIVEDNKCGICVDPHNIEEISNAIKYILDHPKDAFEMGQRGKEAVHEKYSWEKEFNKILKIIDGSK